MRRKRFGAALVLGTLALALALAAGSASGSNDVQLYIVELADRPAVAYDGGVGGLKATRPGAGKKIDPESNDVKAYLDYLKGQHDKAVAKVGGGSKVYDYGYVFNGAAVRLTADQAAKLASVDGVLAVTRSERFDVDTSSTPAFLGLNAPGGLWEQLGGPGDKKVAGAGEDVIVGIVDSGIWPEHPSVSDRDAQGKLVFQQLPGWHGKCVPGEDFSASNCNQKLIGARYYNEGFGGNAGIDATLPFEFNSPRDHNGHGTHTATTAAGNFGVAATGEASLFGSTSGMAPRARIAAYKACWSVPGTAGSCQGVDLVAAIDQAVADGVDVINYSISGSRSNFRDPVEIAFLFAADAGVFVATSAGNNGPTSSTVAHPSPWVTTVAAGTHNRNGAGSVTLGNGVTYQGASVAKRVTAPLVDSTAAGVAGADPAALALCFGAADGAVVLDPAKVAGKIVVCDRGVSARVNKSLAVRQAGGVGMILANTSPNSINADFHFVPTVHVQSTDRAAVKAYAATAGATATINDATIVTTDPAPFTASFSSRGPLVAGAGDLLKPDVIAPGQDVLAGVAPPNNAGRLFDLYSGTSMSSPHVAGLAALLKHRHPDWSPMAIKSALMTTGTDVLDGGTPAPNTNPVLIFRQGAGHVRPNSAADPGLVYDSSFADWLGFLCGTQLPTSFCTSAGVPVLDPSDFNGASIAIGDLAGTQTVTRKVTNVSGKALTVTAGVAGLPGVTTTVTPSSLSLAPGETGSFTVAFTTAGAALNAYVGGQLTWTGGGYSVRSPIVIRPVALAAPLEARGSYVVRFGYNGPFTATARGLVPAAISAGTVADDPTNGTCSLTSPNAQTVEVVVPAGTTYARFSLFDADVAAGSDIDLCVFQGSTQVGLSGSGTSAEEVNLVNPTPATYTAVVHGWGVPGTSPFKLHAWVLGSVDAGNMTVSAPATAAIGATGTVSLGFSGLAAGTKYLGSVAYAGAAGMPNPTIVRVDAP